MPPIVLDIYVLLLIFLYPMSLKIPHNSLSIKGVGVKVYLFKFLNKFLQKKVRLPPGSLTFSNIRGIINPST